MGYLVLLLVFAISCFFAEPKQAIAKDSDIPTGDWRTVPIADVHWHIYRPFRKTSGMDADEEYSKLKKLNVRWAGGVGDGPNKRLIELMGPRYISSYGQYEWTDVFRYGGDSALVSESNFTDFFKEAEELFKSGAISGLGEIHTNSAGINHRNTPIDGPVVQSMYQLVAKYNGWIQIHHSANRAPFNDVIAVVKKHPKTTFVFSHCMYDRGAEKMRRLFQETQNAFCELSATGPLASGPGTPGRGNMLYTDTGLTPQWKSLINDFPDRVMIGSDNCCDLHNRYEELIGGLRKFVLQDLGFPHFSGHIW